jgi:cell division septal protein FtsQ
MTRKPVSTPHTRLRKQPRTRRLRAATAVPAQRLSVPKTAQKRRQRNRRPFNLSMAGVKRVVLSARWLSLGLLALTIYALIIIGMDTRFYLTYVPVEGTLAIPPEEIVAASGLAGHHIFAADPAQAAAQIAELPGVISATVTLRWPNEVAVAIGEESPVAIWQAGSQDYWVTKAGDLIPARIPTVGLLTIIAETDESQTAVSTRPAMEDDLETADDDTTLAADAGEAVTYIPPEVLTGALQLRALRPNIDRLYYRPLGGLSYQDGRGWRAYFGAGANMAQKLVVYETIIEHLLARGIAPQYVSVSNQEKPFYRTQ